MSVSTQITFTQLDRTGKGFKIATDSDRNGGVSMFTLGREWFLELSPGGLRPALTAIRGAVRNILENVLIELTEDLEIINTDSASLQYEPTKLKSLEWTGREPVTAVIDGDGLKLSKISTGLLKVIYETSVDILAISAAAPGKDIIEARTSLRYGYYVPEFFDKISRSRIFQVSDSCTGEPVGGAAVYIDGKLVGYTNEAGEVVAVVTLDVQHTLHARKAGFTNSDDDFIANDYFTCRSSDEDRKGVSIKKRPISTAGSLSASSSATGFSASPQGGPPHA